MSQRNPTKSEFYTFVVDQTSGAGANFFAVNTSGSKQVIFSADALGWNVTNQSRAEALTDLGNVRDTAQYMPLPCCPPDGFNGNASSHLVTFTNDDTLYVFLGANNKAEKCHVWVIR